MAASSRSQSPREALLTLPPLSFGDAFDSSKAASQITSAASQLSQESFITANNATPLQSPSTEATLSVMPPVRRSHSTDSVFKATESTAHDLHANAEGRNLASEQALPQSAHSSRGPTSSSRFPLSTSRTRGDSLPTPPTLTQREAVTIHDHFKPSSHNFATSTYSMGLITSSLTPVQPGQLLLPSRSTSQKLPTISSRILPQPRGTPTQVPEPVSQTSAAESSQANTISRPTTRTRSGSVDSALRTEPGVSGHVKNGSTSTLGSFGAATVAVVGNTGCGKTTLIIKSFKLRKVSEPERCSVALSRDGIVTVFQYEKRNAGTTGNLSELNGEAIDILEIDGRSLQAMGWSSWPEELPRLDALILCYDVSDRKSFKFIPTFLRGLDAALPIMVIACKTDLEARILPDEAQARIVEYNVGIVEVTVANKIGREKMRTSISFLFSSMKRARQESNRSQINPASPTIIGLPAPWEITSNVQGTSPSKKGDTDVAESFSSSDNTPIRPLALLPVLINQQASRNVAVQDPTHQTELSISSGMVTQDSLPPFVGAQESVAEVNQTQPLDFGSKEPPHPQSSEKRSNSESSIPDHPTDPEPRKTFTTVSYFTIEELLEKFFVHVVNGDDALFVKSFVLCYRCFATPRTILLGFQRRLRQLDSQICQSLYVETAKLKICSTLLSWTEDYPGDFAASSTQGALSAVMRLILSSPTLMHYGSDMLHFVELLPQLIDKDAAWAIPIESADDDASSYRFEDGSEDDNGPRSAHASKGVVSHKKMSTKPVVDSREATRAAQSLSSQDGQNSRNVSTLAQDSIVRQLNGTLDNKSVLRKLRDSASAAACYPSEDIAEEITRVMAVAFLSIEPREWIRHSLIKGGPIKRYDPVLELSSFYNRLCAWSTSTILCHDSIKQRVRQIIKYMEVVNHLRSYNNFSGSRAIVVGILNAVTEEDRILEALEEANRDAFKQLKSAEVMFSSQQAHKSYRMALGASTGALIPDAEVHTYDIIRIFNGNIDVHPDDPLKIHWGKYITLGKTISELTDYQMRCRATQRFNFLHRPSISELIDAAPSMDDNLQTQRMDPVPDHLNHDSVNAGIADPSSRLKRLAHNLLR